MDGSPMQLEDWLDDLCVRFIINLPEEDLSSVARICFQVEEAQWFYEDFVRPLDPTLPSMSLRTFCLRIFQHCPLLASFSVENHLQAFEEFLEYKTRVPVRGAIMLNHAMDSAVLVKGWKKGANWSFPRGKINKDEDDMDCAVREVWEETGLDLRAAGLVPTDGQPKYIEISMREQQMRLYVFRDVPMDTNFQPQTRKEISKIEWYKLSELPAFRKKGAQDESGAPHNANKFYMVAPFLVPLKKWVASQKKTDARRAANDANMLLHPHLAVDDIPTEDDAYTHSEAGFLSKTPGVETLEGATQELQRLLKMQPPTQGLQSSVAQEDKASALLSLLQAPSSGNAAPSPQYAQMPHTPLELTAVEASQPRNPHHHNNQRHNPPDMYQPPPSFPLSENHSMPSWGHQIPQSQPPFQRYPGMSPQQQQYGGERINLGHPQPLPRQGHMFNNTTVRDGSQLAQFDGVAQHHQSNVPTDKRQPPLPFPQQPTQPSNAPPMHLNGQSMALLNAFKRNAAPGPIPPPQSNQDTRGRQVTGGNFPGQQVPLSFAQGTAAQGQQQQVNISASPMTPLKGPTELAGSSVGGAPDPHRSALLGMFKKADSVTPLDQKQALGDGSKTASATSTARGTSDPRPLPPLDHLTIQSRPDQSRIATSRDQPGGYPGTNAVHTAKTQAPQPPRILQRGQAPESLGIGGLPMSSPRTSHPSAQGPPKTKILTSPPSAASLPSPTSGGPRPEGSNQQKQQLLSLFGKQPSPLATGTGAGLGESQSPQLPGAEASRSRMASLASESAESSRRGSQTPMSPADQSFLLGYLQSVTNNGTRR